MERPTHSLLSSAATLRSRKSSYVDHLSLPAKLILEHQVFFSILTVEKAYTTAEERYTSYLEYALSTECTRRSFSSATAISSTSPISSNRFSRPSNRSRGILMIRTQRRVLRRFDKR